MRGLWPYPPLVDALNFFCEQIGVIFTKMYTYHILYMHVMAEEFEYFGTDPSNCTVRF